MNIADLEQLNECAEFLYGAGVTVTPVTFPEASELWSATLSLGQICEQLKLGPAWIEFGRLNKVLYYRLAGGICSPAHVVSDMRKELASGYLGIKHSLNGVAQEARQTIEQIVLPETGLWARLVKIECSPFYSIIQEKIGESIRRNQKSAVLILRDNRFKEQTINLLKGYQEAINIEVRKSNELRNHPKVDRVFYVGSMKSLRRLDDEFLLRAPVTDEFEFFELSHTGKIQNAGLDVFALEPGKGFSLNQAPAVGILDGFKPKTATQVADEEFEGDDSVASSELEFETSHLRAVDAFRAILGGGYGANLSAEGDVFIAHCRNQGAALTCTKIEKKEVIDLEPGDFVVLTTDGSGDMIAPYADQIIGPRAKTYRELQLAWKRDLAKLVIEAGTAHVIKELRSNSGFEISASNLRQWLGLTVHGPGKERPRLFDAVLKLLKRDDKIPIHKEALDEIREASMKAGHQLQSELRRKLSGMDMSTVLSDGFMEFRLDSNGPAKTIFELQKLDTAVRSVNPHYINRVFKLKHGEHGA